MLSLSYNTTISTGIDVMTAYNNIITTAEMFGVKLAMQLFGGIKNCEDKVAVLEKVESADSDLKVWHLLNISKDQYLKVKEIWQEMQGKQSTGELRYFARMANNSSLLRFAAIVASDNLEHRITKYEAYKHELH